MEQPLPEQADRRSCTTTDKHSSADNPARLCVSEQGGLCGLTLLTTKAMGLNCAHSSLAFMLSYSDVHCFQGGRSKGWPLQQGKPAAAPAVTSETSPGLKPYPGLGERVLHNLQTQQRCC